MKHSLYELKKMQPEEEYAPPFDKCDCWMIGRWAWFEGISKNVSAIDCQETGRTLRLKTGTTFCEKIHK